MNNSTSSIITIGRQYGSGGRQIGQEIANYFGIKCYDKELLEQLKVLPTPMYYEVGRFLSAR